MNTTTHASVNRWTLTRIDRATGAELSRQDFAGVDEMVQSLRERGIALTDAHAVEIQQHPDTQFDRIEMVNDGQSAYSAKVQYDLRPSDTLPPSPAPRPMLTCRTCRVVGVAGAYPFSTLPDAGQCDDCV